MAQKLIEKAYKNVYALKGGWDEWVESEYPLEPRVQESDESTDTDKKEQENDKKSSETKE